jgi:tRNA(Ile)-lysidine synthase
VPGPHPAVAAVRPAVADALRPLPGGSTVLVACSGGPDSLALAAATAFVAHRGGGARWRVGAVVVDHGMQPGSAQVAQDAARRCRDLGLDPVEVVRVAVDLGAGGPEAAARDARYAALEDAADRHGARAVLLGHTRDDQAEGVLLGLARGSGARSLSGMAPARGRLLRPLLGVSRAQTHAACAAQGIAVWHDPTNLAPDPAPPLPPVPSHPPSGENLSPEPDIDRQELPSRRGGAPLRSRLRSRVLPVLVGEAGPGVVEALARTADLLREDADALDALAADLLARALVTADPRDPADLGDPSDPDPADPSDPDPADPAPGVLLDLAVLADALPALRHRVLRAAAIRAGSPPGALTRTHVLALADLVVRWHGQGPVHLPGGVRGSRACGRLSLRAEPPTTVRTPARAAADVNRRGGRPDDARGELHR